MVSLGKRSPIGRADFRLGRQDEQAGRILRDAEFSRAAKHSLRLDAAQFARLDLEIVRQYRARQSERDFVAHLVIFRAANDLRVSFRCRHRPGKRSAGRRSGAALKR